MEFEIDQLKRLQPSQFLRNCFAANTRPDGRTLHQARPIHSDSATITTAHASSVTSFGNTSVLSAIKFEIAQPESSKPNQGFLVPNVDLGPICCPKYRPGPPNDESQILASRLKDILISSEVVPLGSLVIQPAKFVWVVYIDIVCLSNDGNLFDAIVTAALSALKTARIPAVKFDENRQQVVCANEPTPGTVPVATGPSLSAYTFAIFDDATILPDPTLFEEEFGPGILNLVLDHQHHIYHLAFVPPAHAILSSLHPSILEACFKIIKQNPRSLTV